MAASSLLQAQQVSECAPCHAQRVQEQAASPHAQSLTVFNGAHFSGRSLSERNGATFSYQGNRLQVQQGGEVLEAVIAYAFGSGVQAITPVLEKDGQFLEHRLSWYRDGDRLGLTPGHSPATPLDAVDSLGIPQSARNAARCFGCHQTQTSAGARPGVTCQACHGPGTEHRQQARAGNIPRSRQVSLCANCHRSPDTAAAGMTSRAPGNPASGKATFANTIADIDDPRNVRFAPIGFLSSNCVKAKPEFTCVTCHNPHTAAEPSSSPTYRQVCLGCHAQPASQARPRAASNSSKASSPCPRTEGCVACHMPKVQVQPGLRFANHRIAVHR